MTRTVDQMVCQAHDLSCRRPINPAETFYVTPAEGTALAEALGQYPNATNLPPTLYGIPIKVVKPVVGRL